eukprot:9077969-Lingulodinium_polyedra.AAC.1
MERPVFEEAQHVPMARGSAEMIVNKDWRKHAQCIMNAPASACLRVRQPVASGGDGQQLLWTIMTR